MGPNASKKLVRTRLHKHIHIIVDCERVLHSSFLLCWLCIHIYIQNVMRFNNGECTDICLQFFFLVMQYEQWLVVVVNLKAKRLNILSSTHMVDLMPCTHLAQNILFFLKVLFGKAFARHGVDLKTLQP